MKNTLAILIIGFLLSACETPRTCTMMACIGNLPSITVRLQGFSAADLSHVTIVYADVNSFLPKDSLVFSDGTTNTGNSNEYGIGGIFSGEKELLDYAYIIKTKVSSDTIHKINYEKYMESVPCNKCTDGYEYQTVPNFRNLSFSLNQTKYLDTTAVTITK